MSCTGCKVSQYSSSVVACYDNKMWQKRTFLHPGYLAVLAEAVILHSWNYSPLLLGSAHRTDRETELWWTPKTDNFQEDMGSWYRLTLQVILWWHYLVCLDKNPTGRAHGSSLLCKRQICTEFQYRIPLIPLKHLRSDFFYLKCFIGHFQSN